MSTYISKHNIHKAVASMLITLGIATTLLAYEANAKGVSEADWVKSNEHAITHSIIKPYQSLAIQTQQLQQEISELCLSINIKNIEKAKYAIQSVYIEWANVQHITIGPMSYLQRRERFQYWPDKHSVGYRQLRKLLQEENKKATENKPLITLQQLQRKSVAVQGLPSLERLLFSKKITDKKQLSTTECHLAEIIAINLNELAQDNIDSWAHPPVNFSHDLTHLEEGLSIYQSNKEVANTLFNILSTQLEAVKRLKLQRALGGEGKISQRKQLEAWRSNLSFVLLKTNLNSLHHLYRHAFHIHIKKDRPQLARIITSIFNSLQKMEGIDLYSLLENNPTHAKVEAMVTSITKLQTLIDHDLRLTLGFTSAFNALDGD